MDKIKDQLSSEAPKNGRRVEMIGKKNKLMNAFKRRRFMAGKIRTRESAIKGSEYL